MWRTLSEARQHFGHGDAAFQADLCRVMADIDRGEFSSRFEKEKENVLDLHEATKPLCRFVCGTYAVICSESA